MCYTLGEFLRLIVGKQLADKSVVERAQVVEVAVARTEVDHVEKGTFGSGYADIVLHEDAVQATPKPWVYLAERVDALVYLNRPRKVADRCNAVVILENHACTLQHKLKRNIGRMIQTACQFFDLVATLCVDALSRIQQQPPPYVSVQLRYNGLPVFSHAYHCRRLRCKDCPGAVEHLCNKNFL